MILKSLEIVYIAQRGWKLVRAEDRVLGQCVLNNFLPYIM